MGDEHTRGGGECLSFLIANAVRPLSTSMKKEKRTKGMIRIGHPYKISVGGKRKKTRKNQPLS